MTRERLGYGLVGAGVGGLADGFVLHQVLQWHHLISSRTPTDSVEGLRTNTLADGIFHVVMLAVLVAGILLLAGRAVDRRRLIGLGLLGWGLFHVVDQLVFHLALGAHHIREGVPNPALYDWGFFLIGLLLIAGGIAVAWRLREA